MGKGKYQGKYLCDAPEKTANRSGKRKAKRFPVIVIILIVLAVLALAALTVHFVDKSNGGNGIFSFSVITSQPRSVTANIGDTVEFTVAAKGDGLVYRWQWREDDTSDWAPTTVDGSKTDTIRVPAKASRHGYQYRCEITDPEGNAFCSRAVTLTIESGPSITAQPKSKTAVEGKNVAFSVKATGEGLKYQWQWRKNDSSDWAATTVEGNKTDTITVPVTQARNGYQYRCVVTNAEGLKIASGAAVLTVP